MRPRDTATRERKSLGGLWRFALDPDGAGRRERWWERPLPGAREMPVPASYNDLFADAAVRDHVGDAWYQTASGSRRAGRASGSCCASTPRRIGPSPGSAAREVAEHEGGYTPFEADVTDVVELGRREPDHRRRRQRADLAVDPARHRRGDARRPPAALLPRLLQLRRPPPDVWLYTTPRVARQRRHRRHGPGRRDGTVALPRSRPRAATASRSASRCATPTAPRSRGRAGATGELEVDGVAPVASRRGLPLRARGRAVGDGDAWSTPTRYRSASGPCAVDGTRFLINGEPFYFKGFGKHEDAAVRGKGHDDAFMVHDFALHGVARRQLVPHVALPVRRGGARLRRPPRHRGHRRDRRRRDSTSGWPAASSARSRSSRSPTRRSTPPRRRSTGRRSASWSRATRTTRASCSGASPTSPSPSTPASRAYFEPLAAEARRLDPTRPVGFVNVMLGHARRRTSSPTCSTCSCSTATTAGTSTPATSPPPSASSRPSCRRGSASTASRSSSPSTAPTRSPGCTA